jgi:hypothetical protein
LQAAGRHGWGSTSTVQAGIVVLQLAAMSLCTHCS